MRERGSVSVVLAVLLALGTLAASLAVGVARSATETARVQAAADAVALAAAQEQYLPSGVAPAEAAADYAARNGVRLVSCDCPVGGRSSVVVVASEVAVLGRVRDVRRAARAVVDPPAGWGGLQPWFAARLDCLFRGLPGLTLVSGFRTRAEQAALYREKPELAAPPGRSRHEVGLAADLGFPDAAARDRAHDLAGSCGLRFPVPGEPWHVEPVT